MTSFGLLESKYIFEIYQTSFPNENSETAVKSEIFGKRFSMKSITYFWKLMRDRYKALLSKY